MTKRKWLFGVAALALIGIVLLVRGFWTSDGAAARSQGAARVVPVEVATVERKPMPVRIESLGNVTPIASVAIKARVDTTITAVHFRDGAEVKKGDLLFTLDGRAIEAQIAQTEGAIARDKAQLDRRRARRRALHRPGRQERHPGRQSRQRQDPGRRSIAPPSSRTPGCWKT